MHPFTVTQNEVTQLSDKDLRELVARLCMAELSSSGASTAGVRWGGVQQTTDGGFDVVTDAQEFKPVGYIPRPTTAFQVKKGSLGEKGCRSEMQPHGKLRPSIVVLGKKGGAYIIVSGSDNCSETMRDSRIKGMKDALKGVNDTERPLVDFYGVDQLANWANLYIGVVVWVKTRLGAPPAGWQPFRRWAETPSSQTDTFHDSKEKVVYTLPPQNHTLFEGIKLARTLLRDTSKCLRVVGLSGVGKTRFVQALFENSVPGENLPSEAAIYADVGESISPPATQMLDALIQAQSFCYLVLDNCPPDLHRRLAARLAAEKSKTKLITIEYDILEDQPEETNVIHLQSGDEDAVRQIIKQRFKSFSAETCHVISSFSGGNSRVALALANAVEPGDNLVMKNDLLFKRIVFQRQSENPELLKAGEVLALPYSFSVGDQENADELGTLGLMVELSRDSMFRHHSTLRARGLVQSRGSWRAVLPHAIAIYFARMALQNISPETLTGVFLRRENDRLLESLSRRLVALKGLEQAEVLAERIFDHIVTLDDSQAWYMTKIVIFRNIAKLLPRRALEAIEMAMQDRDFISRDNPRFIELTNLVVNLASEEKFFSRSAKILTKFSEIEDPDEQKNSVAEKLAVLFQLYLPGTNCSPDVRQQFVRELSCSEFGHKFSILHKIFIRALETRHWSNITPLETTLAAPIVNWFPRSDEEIVSWYLGFLRILADMINSTETDSGAFVESVIAQKFQQLWNISALRKNIAQLIVDNRDKTVWSNVWNEVKLRIFNDSANSAEEIDLLVALEEMLRPVDLKSKLKGHVFIEGWRYSTGDDRSEIDEKLVALELGRELVENSSIFQEICENIWDGSGDTIFELGEGAGKSDKELIIYKVLTEDLERRQSTPQNLNFLMGYLKGASSRDTGIHRVLRAGLTAIPILAPAAVALLTCVEIDEWCEEQILILAQREDVPAAAFLSLRFRRVAEHLSLKLLEKLVSFISRKSGGALVLLQLVHCRRLLALDQNDDERITILTNILIPLIHELSCEAQYSGEISPVVFEQTISYYYKDSTDFEILDIWTKSILSTLKNYGTHYHKRGVMLGCLLKIAPPRVLSLLYKQFQSEPFFFQVIYDRFGNNYGVNFEAISPSALADWCEADAEKIAFALEHLQAFERSTHNIYHEQINEPDAVSAHVLSLKSSILPKDFYDFLFSRLIPPIWSDRLSSIVSRRLEALMKHLTHEDTALQRHFSQKIYSTESQIRSYKQQEESFGRRNEQRFE